MSIYSSINCVDMKSIQTHMSDIDITPQPAKLPYHMGTSASYALNIRPNDVADLEE